MNNIIVYCEFEDGRVADVSLELLTKGRKLANKLNCKLEALIIGANLDGVEKQVTIRHCPTRQSSANCLRSRNRKSPLWAQPPLAATLARACRRNCTAA